jgi:hypothetical protein
MPEVQPIPVTFLCSEADPIVPNPSIPVSTAVINKTIRVKFYPINQPKPTLRSCRKSYS